VQQQVPQRPCVRIEAVRVAARPRGTTGQALGRAARR
jgi:hypothetical protein